MSRDNSSRALSGLGKRGNKMINNRTQYTQNILLNVTFKISKSLSIFNLSF